MRGNNGVSTWCFDSHLFGEALKRRRIKAGFSSRESLCDAVFEHSRFKATSEGEFAEEVTIHKDTLRGYETGRSVPTLHMFAAMLEAMYGEEWPEQASLILCESLPDIVTSKHHILTSILESQKLSSSLNDLHLRLWVEYQARIENLDKGIETAQGTVSAFESYTVALYDAFTAFLKVERMRRVYGMEVSNSYEMFSGYYLVYLDTAVKSCRNILRPRCIELPHILEILDASLHFAEQIRNEITEAESKYSPSIPADKEADNG